MFGSETLDVAIGMVFVYLLLSIICTGIIELIANIFKFKSSHLEKGIAELMRNGGEKFSIKEFYKHPLVAALYKNKSKETSFLTRTPSYISSTTFSRVVLDLVISGNEFQKNSFETLKESRKLLPADWPINKVIESSINETVDSYNYVKSSLEKYYDESMERVRGWYKRRIMLFTYVVATILTISLNVDSINIVKTLYTNDELRASLVDAANTYLEEAEMANSENDSLTVGADSTGKINDTIKITDLYKKYEGIADNYKELNKHLSILGWNANSDQGKDICARYSNFPACIPGWLITIFAISLGAPFWFDIMQKLVKIRTSKAKEKESDTK